MAVPTSQVILSKEPIATALAARPVETQRPRDERPEYQKLADPVSPSLPAKRPGGTSSFLPFTLCYSVDLY